MNIVHKRLRFSRFSMSDQTQIINYFKSASHSFNSLEFNAFISSFCSAFRSCFSVNRGAGTSQSNKASKGFKSAVSASSICSAPRLYLPANGPSRLARAMGWRLRRPHRQRYLTAFAVLTNNGTPPSSPPSYGFMYSRRDDAERERGMV